MPKQINLDPVQGTGYDVTTDSLEIISGEIAEILDLTLTTDTITVSTDTETTVYEDAAPTEVRVGLSMKVDTSAMAGTETFIFREYYVIEAGGSYLQTANTMEIVDPPSQPLQIMDFRPYRFGMKITVQRTVGSTTRDFKIELVREA